MSLTIQPHNTVLPVAKRFQYNEKICFVIRTKGLNHVSLFFFIIVDIVEGLSAE